MVKFRVNLLKLVQLSIGYMLVNIELVKFVFANIVIGTCFCMRSLGGGPVWKKNAHLANISFCSVSAKKIIYIIIIKNPPKFI